MSRAAAMQRVYLSLGANLGEPRAQLTAAVRAIAAISGSELIACSPLYQTAALGSTDVQPDYLNLVLALTTSLSPDELWQQLSRIEASVGRSREASMPRNAARLIDIDVLLIGDQIIQSVALTVPHPRMHERAFVLQPLHDIAPDLAIPQRGAVSALLRALPLQRITRFSEPLTWI